MGSHTLTRPFSLGCYFDILQAHGLIQRIDPLKEKRINNNIYRYINTYFSYWYYN